VQKYFKLLGERKLVKQKSPMLGRSIVDGCGLPRLMK
jgi:hypothetical protein